MQVASSAERFVKFQRLLSQPVTFVGLCGNCAQSTMNVNAQLWAKCGSVNVSTLTLKKNVHFSLLEGVFVTAEIYSYKNDEKLLFL